MAKYEYPVLLSIEKNPPEGDLHLMPCPFCGTSEIIYWQYETAVGPRWKIFCLKCAAGVDPGWAQQRYPLVSIWNRRYRDDPGTSGENNQGNLQDGD